jgi:hypothetical protein
MRRAVGWQGQRRGMKVLISWLEAQPPTGGYKGDYD